MVDRLLKGGVVALASGRTEDGCGDDLEIAGFRIRRLPAVVAGVVTQPPQDQVPDLGTRSRGTALLVLFVLPLLVTRHPIGDLDVPGLQGVLEVARHRGVSVTVVQVQPSGIAREFTDRTLGPR
jgi:hypothetical protein